MVQLIIVGSNVWIFAEVENAPEHKAAIEKLRTLLREGLGINAVVYSEVFHKLSRLFDRGYCKAAGRPRCQRTTSQIFPEPLIKTGALAGI